MYFYIFYEPLTAIERPIPINPAVIPLIIDSLKHGILLGSRKISNKFGVSLHLNFRIASPVVTIASGSSLGAILSSQTSSGSSGFSTLSDLIANSFSLILINVERKENHFYLVFILRKEESGVRVCRRFFSSNSHYNKIISYLI